MTLTTHGVVGAGVMAVFSANPLLGGALAFGSHFLLDALPHLDYKILSLDHDVHRQSQAVKLKWGRTAMLDLGRIGLDFCLGLSGAILIYNLLDFRISWWLVLLGAVLGMLPDFLQFVYGHQGGKILGFIQSIHNFFHTHYRLEGKILIGVTSQLGLIGLVFLIINLYL